MKSRRTAHFNARFAKLPDAVKRLAEKNYRLWKADARHPSLQFKCIWFWIGPHDEYERIIRGL